MGRHVPVFSVYNRIPSSRLIEDDTLEPSCISTVIYICGCIDAEPKVYACCKKYLFNCAYYFRCNWHLNYCGYHCNKKKLVVVFLTIWNVHERFKRLKVPIKQKFDGLPREVTRGIQINPEHLKISFVADALRRRTIRFWHSSDNKWSH